MMLFTVEHWTKLLHPATVTALFLIVCLAKVQGEDAPKSAGTPGSAGGSPPSDPYLWLEDVTGEKPLAWVKEQNAVSTRELEASPNFEPIRKRLLSILDSKEKIPYVAKHGAYYYNFWRDEKNARGLWRRTTLAEFKKPEPAWETVLDLDQLSATEKENWVWKGYNVLKATTFSIPVTTGAWYRSRGAARMPVSYGNLISRPSSSLRTVFICRKPRAMLPGATVTRFMSGRISVLVL
jgi:hypothetical protein